MTINIPIASGKTSNFNYFSHLHSYISGFDGVSYGIGSKGIVNYEIPEIFLETYKPRNTYRTIYSYNILLIAKEKNKRMFKCRNCEGWEDINQDTYSIGHGICKDCFKQTSKEYHNSIKGSGFLFSEYIDAKILADKLIGEEIE